MSRHGSGDVRNGPAMLGGSRRATCSPKDARRAAGSAARTGHVAAKSSCCYSKSWRAPRANVNESISKQTKTDDDDQLTKFPIPFESVGLLRRYTSAGCYPVACLSKHNVY